MWESLVGNVATTVTGKGLKSSSERRGVDLGDHLRRRWLIKARKSLKSGGSSGNQANKMPSLAAALGVVEGLGQYSTVR